MYTQLCNSTSKHDVSVDSIGTNVCGAHVVHACNTVAACRNCELGIGESDGSIKGYRRDYV